MKINLKKYGLTTNFEQAAQKFTSLRIARVTAQHRDIYQLMTDDGSNTAKVSGKFAYNSTDSVDFPAVGDWVMVSDSDQVIIHDILPRKSVLARGTTGNGQQIIATNIDTIFICMSLNENFSPRRLERYLTIAWDSQSVPVVVLTKADLCDDLADKLAQLEEVCFGVEIIICSATEQSGLDELSQYLTAGKTVAFVGSSGVGKSTLINQLMGEEVLATNSIREDDDKGRHTTTHRQLLLLPQGGVVIDTPGMRELQVHTQDLSRTFEDIDELSQQCRFRNCTHTSEPGCAVKRAIKDGELDVERLKSYQKLQNETSYEGLNSRQLENEKVKRLFGSKNEMKNLINQVKKRNRR